MSKKMMPEREIICVVFNILWFTRAVIYCNLHMSLSKGFCIEFILFIESVLGVWN